MLWGYSSVGRAVASHVTGQRFESAYLHHVGTSYARSDFLLHKKSVTRFTVPPFSQKVPPRLRCSLVNALATLRFATNFLRVTRVQIPSPICRKYLFYSLLTRRRKPFWPAAIYFLNHGVALWAAAPLPTKSATLRGPRHPLRLRLKPLPTAKVSPFGLLLPFFESSSPASETSKISFSCGLDTSPQLCRLRRFSFFYMYCSSLHNPLGTAWARGFQGKCLPIRIFLDIKIHRFA